MNKLAWLTLVFLLCASPVSAEIKGGDLSVTLGGLGYLSDGVQHQHFGPGATLKLGYDITNHFGLEGSFDYIASESTMSKSWWGDRFGFRLDAVVNLLPDSRFVPYVSGGVGFMYVDDLFPPVNTTRNHTDFLLSAGGGAKFFLTDSIALRADFRPIVTFDEDAFVNFEAMLGVSYYFGRPTKPAAPAQAAVPVAAPAVAPEPRVIVQEEADVPPPVTAPVPLPAPVDEGPASWEGTVNKVPAGKIMITSMKVEGNALVLTTTGRVANYRVFSLAQPSRLILDMANTVNGMGKDNIAVHKLGIAAVRFGSYPDTLRVVLDAEQSELLPYRVEEMENGLKIVMTVPKK